MISTKTDVVTNRNKNAVVNTFFKKASRDKYLILMFLPVFLYFVLFRYVPMYGIVMGFQDFSISKGILGSSWVGLKWIHEFTQSFYFWRLIKNTVMLSVLSIVFYFPIPILFALLLNELKAGSFKRIVQTVSYLPYFISIVVVIGIFMNLLSPTDGIVKEIYGLFGMECPNFFRDPAWFRPLYIGTKIWQHFGWDSIIYIAALASINPELYEAAYMDGANRWHKLIYISLPGIAPTIVILFILAVGNLLNVGFEKIILMYSPSTYETADVISTYVYRRGIMDAQYSFGTAIGFFNSIINMILLVATNWICKKISDISLF